MTQARYIQYIRTWVFDTYGTYVTVTYVILMISFSLWELWTVGGNWYYVLRICKVKTVDDICIKLTSFHALSWSQSAEPIDGQYDQNRP